jgi:predicted DNA-binding mobile mystery protein A
MRVGYQDLRLKQLTNSLVVFDRTRQAARPRGGWLHAIRQALGLSRQHVATIARVNQQQIAFFETSEANDRITLRSLRRVAAAMDCELVYAIVPKTGTLQDLADQRLRSEVSKNVLATEKSMALEGQGTGDLKEKIEDEVKRIKAGKK